MRSIVNGHNDHICCLLPILRRNIVGETKSFYVFKWRRCLLWKSVNAITHRYDAKQDKLVVFRHPGGGLYEIKQWSKCEARLGDDWVTALTALQADAANKAAAQVQARIPLTPPGSPAAGETSGK
jgi:hypothetical protein